jgi:hypothetical protein
MISKEHHEQIITDYEKFNDFLKSYTEHIIQRVMLDIPHLVLHHVKEIQEMNKLRKKFFSDYPELKDKAKYVNIAVSRILQDRPDLDKAKVFEEAGPMARDIINKEKNNGQGI